MTQKSITALVFCMLLPIVATHATTIYVPDNYPTVQGAIDASISGDSVIVRPGVYYENIDFVGKTIVLQSELGPQVTTIDGSQSGSVVIFKSGESSSARIEGFTLTNGTGTVESSSSRGGAIFCTQWAAPAIRNNVISANTAYSGGGISCGFYSSPLIIENVIQDNSVPGEYSQGAGLYVSTNSTPTIESNTITNNTAPGTYSTGGGISCHSSTADIFRNTISANTAASGGGVHCAYNAYINLERNLIERNTAVVNGGGIMTGYSSPRIAENRIAENSAIDGGGIFCGYGSPIIEDNLIVGHDMINTANSTGGGVFLSSSACTLRGNTICINSAEHGGGISCTNSLAVIVGNRIDQNLAYYGGGIELNFHANPIIGSNLLSRNEASYGGGLYARWRCAPVMVNNTIVDNKASSTYGRGGGLCIEIECVAVVTNSILWGNQAVDGKEAYIAGYGYSQPSILEIDHSDVEGAQGSVFVDTISILRWDQASMIDADPLFRDGTNGDCHLTYGSPCRESGRSDFADLPGTDFEGDPRVAGSGADMGADEFYYHLYHMGDVTPGANVDLTIVGYPLAPVTLAWGQSIVDPPIVTQHGSLHIWPFQWSSPVGNIATDGFLSMSVTVPATWSSGDFAPLQALVGPWNGFYTRFTNLETLTVE